MKIRSSSPIRISRNEEGHVLFWTPPLLGFVIATLLTWIELVTSKYPRTLAFVFKSASIYVYCLICGFIAFGVLMGFDSRVASGMLKTEGLGLSHAWIRAAEIGIAVKALLHIRLFTVSSGAQAFPVGVESVVQLFEPWLLDRVAQDEFNNVQAYVTTLRQKYRNDTLSKIQTKLKANIRPNLPPAEKAGLILDIEKATLAEEAMTIYLARFGRPSLERLYP